MAVYVVTWNLNREGANYSARRTAFLNHLARYPNVADPALETVRWVSSAGTASALSLDLRHQLDANDSIFVSRLVDGSYDGFLSQPTWDWVRSRL